MKNGVHIGGRVLLASGRMMGVSGALALGFVVAVGCALDARAGLYESGHGDVDIAYDALPTGEWELGFHLEGAVVDGVSGAEGEFGAADLVVLVPASTSTTRPGGSAWDPLGVAAGEEFWFLPQSGTLADSLGAPFLGIATEEIGAGEFVGDQVSLSLIGVSGPGDFSVWQDGLSPTFYMSTADGVDAGDALSLATGTHAHFNYGFSAPGLYEVTFQASGNHAVDGLVTSNPTVFSFQVIPEPGTLSLAAAGITMLLAVRRWRNRG